MNPASSRIPSTTVGGSSGGPGGHRGQPCARRDERLPGKAGTHSPAEHGQGGDHQQHPGGEGEKACPRRPRVPGDDVEQVRNPAPCQPVAGTAWEPASMRIVPMPQD